MQQKLRKTEILYLFGGNFSYVDKGIEIEITLVCVQDFFTEQQEK